MVTTLENAYPLAWPTGRKRTDQYDRDHGRFDVTFSSARDGIVYEITLLCGKWAPIPNIVISTNVSLRRDGLPHAGQKQPDDVGVAVYFTYKKRQMCFACDRWKKIEHNMRAIENTIAALRGISRWGTGDMLEAAFNGFVALPAPAAHEDWQAVLGLREFLKPTVDDVQYAYRVLASAYHPDRPGGSFVKMAALNVARDQALKELQ